MKNEIEKVRNRIIKNMSNNEAQIFLEGYSLGLARAQEILNEKITEKK
jgi:hypothetical protein